MLSFFNTTLIKILSEIVFQQVQGFFLIKSIPVRRYHDSKNGLIHFSRSAVRSFDWQNQIRKKGVFEPFKDRLVM